MNPAATVASTTAASSRIRRVLSNVMVSIADRYQNYAAGRQYTDSPYVSILIRVHRRLSPPLPRSFHPHLRLAVAHPAYHGGLRETLAREDFLHPRQFVRTARHQQSARCL